MKLSEYLTANSISDAAFAAALGIARQAVHRYRIGIRIPDKAAMAKIVAATEGEVTPNDFYSSETVAADAGAAPT